MQHLQFLETLVKRVHFNFRHHRTNTAISALSSFHHLGSETGTKAQIHVSILARLNFFPGLKPYVSTWGSNLDVFEKTLHVFSEEGGRPCPRA
mgnify:CR=1 FL=1